MFFGQSTHREKRYPHYTNQETGKPIFMRVGMIVSFDYGGGDWKIVTVHDGRFWGTCDWFDIVRKSDGYFVRMVRDKDINPRHTQFYEEFRDLPDCAPKRDESIGGLL